MAFPTAGTPVQTQFATSVTSMAVNMPATVDSGDLLIAIVEVRNTGTFTPPSGWTQFFTQAGGSSVGRLTGFYKIADGTEDGGTATWTHSAATSAIWQTIRVTSWHGTTPPEATTASGDFTTQPNSPSLTPSWGADDTLWLTVAGNTAGSSLTTGAPTSYSGYQLNSASAGGAQCNVASANRQLNAASEDPGTFANPGSIRYWAAATIGVAPAGGGGNTAPTVALNSPADSATGVANPPNLDFTGTDADADDITYQLQLDTVNTFDSGDQDIEFIGKNEAEATSITIPAHQAGDLIVIFAARNGSNSAPTVPAGFTSKGVNTGTNCAVVVAQKVAASGSETSGTWTNANLLIAIVYRNADHITRHAGDTSGGLPSTTLNFPSIGTMEDAGNSWGLRFAYISTTDTALDTAPSLFTNRANLAGASNGEVAGHDTNGAVSSVGFGSANVGGSSGDWITQTIEIVKTSGGGSGALIDVLSDTDSGFSNVDTPADTDPFNSGDKVRYTVPSALMEGTTYYWRARGKDPSGSDTFGDWATTRSFTAGAVSGGTADTDERDAVLTGTDTANDERDAKVTGKESANAERGAKTTGKDQANAERSGHMYGQDTATAERDGHITGKESANAERDAHVFGKDTENSSRDAKTTGKQTANDERGAKTTGVEGSNDERGGHVFGQDTANSVRNAKTTGKQTDASERAAKTTGKQATNDQRPAKTTGKLTTNDERAAVTTGKQSINALRSAKTTGTETASAERDGHLIGRDTDSSERGGHILVSGGEADERGGHIFGTDTDADSRAAHTTGKDSASALRSAKVSGVDTIVSTRSLHMFALDSALDEVLARLTGKDSANDYRDMVVTGINEANDSRLLHIYAEALAADEIQATLTGIETTFSVRFCRMRGRIVRGETTILGQSNQPSTLGSGHSGITELGSNSGSTPIGGSDTRTPLSGGKPTVL